MNRVPLAVFSLAAALLLAGAPRAGGQEEGDGRPVHARFALETLAAAALAVHGAGQAPGVTGGETRNGILEAREELQVTVELWGAVQTVQRLAAWTTDRATDGVYDSVTRPGIIESYLLVRPFSGASVSVGIMQQSFGNSFTLNPADWFYRYVDDPLVPGAESFLGAEARAVIGTWSFLLAFIPALPGSAGLFNTRPNHIGLFKLGFPLGSASVTGAFFTEVTPAMTAFFGTGLEAQVPIAEVGSVDAQLLVSNGKKAFLLLEGTPLMPGYRERSEDEVFIDAAISGEVTIASFVTVGLGYAYAGRGVSAQGLARLVSDGYAPARDAGLDALLPAYAVLLWPPSLLDHLLSVSLAIPRLTETLGIAVLAFASPVDPSAWLRLMVSWAPLESVQLEVSGELGIGAEGSLFVPFRREGIFMLACRFTI